MSIFSVLLAIAARGGLRIGPSILTISLFTALAVAIHTLTYSYAAQAPILAELAPPPTILISSRPTDDAIAVSMMSTTINNQAVTVLAAKDLNQLTATLNMKIQGTLPTQNQALIGQALNPLTANNTLTIEGQTLQVTGLITTPTYLSHTIIIPHTTIDQLNGAAIATQIFLTQQPTSTILGQAPSFQLLVHQVIAEARTALTSVTYLLYILLALASATQGYTTMVKAQRISRVFSILGTSRGKMTLALTATALTIGIACVALGYALGILASALIASTTALTLGLPHLKPLVSLEVLDVLLIGFLTASTALTLGLVHGYLSHLDRHPTP